MIPSSLPCSTRYIYQLFLLNRSFTVSCPLHAQDGDDDDDDDDDLTLARFPNTQPVISKMRPDGRKQAGYEVVRAAVPYQSVRETVLTSWGIPTRIPCTGYTVCMFDTTTVL